TQTTKVVDGKYSARFISQIATLENFSAVGYEITLSYGKTMDAMTEGKTQIWKTGTVYSSILAGDKTEKPNAAEGGNYLVAVPVRDIPVSDDFKFVKFDISPFTVSLTGETVYAAGAGASVVIESGEVKEGQLQTRASVPQTIVDPVTGKTLKLTWYDEFSGSTLNESKWKLENRMKSENGKVATTTDRKNIRLENGKAVMDLYQDGDRYYSHRTLTTMDRMSFQYGYLEIYAKVPFSQGAWPSFWLQSARQHRKDVSVMTEVDVFEVYQSGNVEGTLHKWKLGTDDKPTHECWNDPGKYYFTEKWENPSDEYHLWGFGWTKEMIYLTVDGEVFATFDITDNGDFCQGKGKGTLTGMNCFQDPLFINFTNWVGTNFRDSNWAPNENTVFPKTFSVAWVRLYQDETGTLYNN
ncbi:MAG: glycoside hydrolase family 16 protein, partial [Eubacteriales bacterium]|nr:glycoside hydrolase family 16 protein [Eubacteriales bacterium]